MDKIIKQIERIRDINKQHKLVIFVGAGVSRNSGVCSWWDLVKEMAEKIGYNDICEKCQMKNLLCSECGEDLELCSFNNYRCQYKYNFSTDEFLKIPQFFYEKEGNEKYNEFLDEKFNKVYDTNVIDELIISLNPEHIITTNYDHLIENVKHIYRNNYTTIKNDSDMLQKYGKNYIIKMHGDINDKENIVLKEDDYLKYSHTHEIIESYIKSLLFDKTFLFVGYSLNDNNLKLIMSYIDHFARNKEIERSNHYLVVNNIEHKDRLSSYWRNKNVELVDLSNITTFMKEQTKCDLKEPGKPLYSFLKYIKDDCIPYTNDKITLSKSFLIKNFKKLYALNYISYSTLLSLCHFSHPVKKLKGYLYFYNKSEYLTFEELLKQQDKESKFIKDIFLKADIKGIVYNKNKEIFYDFSQENKDENSLFELSLNNNYLSIFSKLKNSKNNLEKAYYYSLILSRDYGNIYEVMSNIEEDINSLDYSKLSEKDIFKIVVYKYNAISLRLLNYKFNNGESFDYLNVLIEKLYQNNKVFEFIKNLTGNNSEMLNKLNSLLLKHEEYYMKKDTIVKWGGTIYGDLLEIQSVVYDYYLFYKKNYLMLDWFKEVKEVCAPYIKAILCTYYPDGYQYTRDSILSRTQVKPYPLSLMDIDMIVKHCNFKDFCSWINHYKVSSIRIEESVDISELFSNFCHSIWLFFNINYHEQLKVFCKLISLVELTEQQKNCIIKALLYLIKPNERFGIEMIRNSLNALWIYVVKHYCKSDPSYKELLNLLINIKLIKEPLDGMISYQNLIQTLLPNADEDIYKSCCELIKVADAGREKTLSVFIFRSILLKYDCKKWQNWIASNIKDNWTKEVYEYLQNDIIVFDENVKNYYIDLFKKTNKSDIIISFPDHKTEAINSIVVLYLEGKISDKSDIEFIKEFSADYAYVDFIFNPETFDYSKVKTSDYIWCYFIDDDKYRDLIIKHKKDFWNEDDEKRIGLGFGNVLENKVAYKYLIE